VILSEIRDAICLQTGRGTSNGTGRQEPVVGLADAALRRPADESERIASKRDFLQAS
jgi:hypothetical protein